MIGKSKKTIKKVRVRFSRTHRDSVLGDFFEGNEYEIAAEDMWRLEIYPDRYEEVKTIAASDIETK